MGALENETHLLIATLSSSHPSPPQLNLPEVTAEKKLNPTVQILKGTNLTGLLGGHKRRLGVKFPSVVQGQSPSRGLGDEVPQKFKLFS